MINKPKTYCFVIDCNVFHSWCVVVLPDPFRGMGAWRNSTETQQSGHASRSGPEVKNGRNTAPTSCCLNVVVRSPPLYPRGGPKWRDNFPEGSDHPVAPNRLEQRRLPHVVVGLATLCVQGLK